MWHWSYLEVTSLLHNNMTFLRYDVKVPANSDSHPVFEAMERLP